MGDDLHTMCYPLNKNLLSLQEKCTHSRKLCRLLARVVNLLFCRLHSPTHPPSLVAQVAGETEVKAQIKLRFLTATRQPVVVIRSFQVCGPAPVAWLLQLLEEAGRERL